MTDVHEIKANRSKRRHRSPHGAGLFVTDQELIEELGVPPETAKPVLAELDRDRTNGFPPKQKLWGDRRYRPAVEAWLDRVYGLKLSSPRRNDP